MNDFGDVRSLVSSNVVEFDENRLDEEYLRDFLVSVDREFEYLCFMLLFVVFSSNVRYWFG